MVGASNKGSVWPLGHFIELWFSGVDRCVRKCNAVSQLSIARESRSAALSVGCVRQLCLVELAKRAKKNRRGGGGGKDVLWCLLNKKMYSRRPVFDDSISSQLFGVISQPHMVP